MTTLHRDTLFAPIDTDLHLARIGGGNETEVYTTDDQRYVVKVKSDHEGDHCGDLAEMVEWTRIARRSARKFARIVGPQHSIPSYYVISRSKEGAIKSIVLQPFLAEATPLFSVDYSLFPYKQRLRIAKQLTHLIYRSAMAFRQGGMMPDLYGRSSSSVAERKLQKSWRKLPDRLWSFLVKRSLLRSHNLMLIDKRKPRILLVDYDTVPHGKLYKLIYYQVRLALFWRDLLLIWLMVITGIVR